ncbi:hypothetical protein FB45DRAFT_1020600 [Roridomyces roridus]|uniref:Protein kinase domain-containing protein n=1 Tax=Roridomyces roridus TaxID=1738132 RepID=A0AAD7CAA3_9AGAR|nr:hypothetical protein FB45DRAFT_1020600 [Roridomyces roridus]
MSTPDSIHIRFEGPGNSGAGRTFSIHKWPIAGRDNFDPLPRGTRLCISHKRGLFTNQPIDRRSVKVDISEALSWGLNDEAHVIYACTSRHYCVRFIFHAERVLRNPESQSLQAYKRLVRDAQFHSTHLQSSDIKGVLVPVHYGMWMTNTGDWGGKVIMSITQYCGTHWNELQYSRMNTQANRELVGRAFETLHDCDFEHGKMITGRDFRHAVIDIFEPGLTLQDLKTGQARCYIVDFSEAAADHNCARRLPVLPLDGYTAQFGCDELKHVTLALEFFDRPIPAVTSKALAWHDQYISKHPDVPNQYVMMEQRAQFFEHRTLYPALALVYDSEGRVDIRMASDSDDETTVDSERTNSACPETVAGGLKQLTLDDPDPITV